MQTLTSYFRLTARTCLMPLAERAAKSYIAGPDLDDALEVANELAQRGFAATIGYWDGAGDTPHDVAVQYGAGIDALAAASFDGYLSIKLPALGDSPDHYARVLGQAAATRQRIHFDSLGPEAADAMWSAAANAARSRKAAVSCSIPGRWRRSVDDADMAVASGIIPRVVKGQWADPICDATDLRQGFMKVVEHLAGRAPHVAIASHDGPLVRDAIRCCKAAGTTCELELLFGLPEKAALAIAESEDLAVRFYVPYGKAYLPYCLGQIRRQPRLIWWLMRDALLRS